MDRPAAAVAVARGGRDAGGIRALSVAAALWRIGRAMVDLPDGTKCNNDGVLPGTVTFKVDASRQDGTFTTTNPAISCRWGLAPGYTHSVFFTLTRI